MTDEEILARLPTHLHPYLRKSLACRILRPVELGSKEFHFAMSVLFVIADQPELIPTRWPEIAKAEMRDVDPAFARRCHRVVQHVKTNIARRASLLQTRLAQADGLFSGSEDAGFEGDG